MTTAPESGSEQPRRTGEPRFASRRVVTLALTTLITVAVAVIVLLLNAAGLPWWAIACIIAIPVAFAVALIVAGG